MNKLFNPLLLLLLAVFVSFSCDDNENSSGEKTTLQAYDLSEQDVNYALLVDDKVHLSYHGESMSILFFCDEISVYDKRDPYGVRVIFVPNIVNPVGEPQAKKKLSPVC
jgi:hypothetical protein